MIHSYKKGLFLICFLLILCLSISTISATDDNSLADLSQNYGDSDNLSPKNPDETLSMNNENNTAEIEKNETSSVPKNNLLSKYAGRSTKINISDTDYSVGYNNITLNVTTNSGINVKNGSVILKVNKTQWTKSVKDGRVTFENIKLEPGNSTLYLRYVGNNYYSGSTLSKNVFLKMPVYIYFDEMDVTYGTYNTLYVYGEDYYGNPLNSTEDSFIIAKAGEDEGYGQFFDGHSEINFYTSLNAGKT